METLLRQMPSPLAMNGKFYRLTLTKLKDKWLVSYEPYTAGDKQLIWRFNPKLEVALKMMIGWLYQNNLIVEEESNVDFRKLDEITK